MGNILDGMVSIGNGLVRLSVRRERLLPLPLWKNRDGQIACVMHNDLVWVEWDTASGFWIECISLQPA